MLRKITTILLLFLSALCSAQEFDNKYLDSLIELQSKMEDDDTNKLNCLVKICHQHYNVDSTYKYSQILYNLAKKNNHKAHQVNALSHLAWCNLNFGKYSESISQIYQTLGLGDASSTKPFKAGLYLLLGFDYYGLGNFYYADEFCRKSLEIYDEIGNQEKVANVYRIMGSYCIDYQFFGMAQEYITNSYEIEKGRYSRGEVETLISFGFCDFSKFHTIRRDTALIYRSLGFFLRANEISIENNYQDLSAESLGKTALVYSELAMISKNKALIDSTKRYYDRGYELTKKFGIVDHKIFYAVVKILINCMENKLSEAGREVKKIKDFYENNQEAGIKYFELYYHALIVYYKSKKDYKTALYYLDESRKTDLRRYNYDLGKKITKLQAEENYNQYVNSQDNEMKNREEEFEKRKTKGQETNKLLTLLLLPGIMLIIVFAGLTIYHNMVNYKLKQQNQQIKEQNEELNKQREEFHELQQKFKEEQDELLYQRKQFKRANNYIRISLLRACNIQTALIPDEHVMENIFGECLIYWNPLEIVSGDFYWAQQISDLKILVTADCTGHGVPGAFMSVLGISTLNDIVTNRDLNNESSLASDIMEDMRSKIILFLHQNCEGNEQYDAIDMSILIIPKDKNKVQYAGANRPLWIENNQEIKIVEPDEISAGIDLMGNNSFTNHVIEVQEGATIYTFSDGITDQFGGKNGKMKFGSKRLKKLLEEISVLTFREQRIKLKDAISEWTTQKLEGETIAEIYRPQLDDQLLIGIKV